MRSRLIAALAVSLTSCVAIEDSSAPGDADTERATLQLERNKEIIRRWLRELDARNPDVYDELYAEGAIAHFPGGVHLAREDAIAGEEAWYQAFPTSEHVIDDLVAEGDKVALRETVHVTHLGEFQGVAPTGRSLGFTALLVYRIEAGQIAEVWVEADLTGLAQRLADPEEGP